MDHLRLEPGFARVDGVTGRRENVNNTREIESFGSTVGCHSLEMGVINIWHKFDEHTGVCLPWCPLASHASDFDGKLYPSIAEPQQRLSSVTNYLPLSESPSSSAPPRHCCSSTQDAAAVSATHLSRRSPSSLAATELWLHVVGISAHVDRSESYW